MKAELLLARFISIIFHPLIIPTLGTVMLFSLPSYITYKIDNQQKIQLTTLILITTFIFPALFSLIMVKLRWIRNMEMRSTGERRLPYLITVTFYFITYYLLRNTQLPNIFLVMILGATLSVLLGLIINLAWKISAHMIGIGGLTGAILAVSLRLNINLIMPLALAFIIAGVVAYARLRLNSHSPSQIYTGFLIGFLSQFFLILIS